MSKYTYESDLRKYMGLDDAPSSKPLRLATGGAAKMRHGEYYASGGSPYQKDEEKKDKKNEIGAIIGGALAGVVGAGAAYMAYKRRKTHPQNSYTIKDNGNELQHKKFIPNPGHDENAGYDDEVVKAEARNAARKLHENARAARNKGAENHSVMSNRHGGYKGQMGHDNQQEYRDVQQETLDRWQDTDSPQYQKKLRDIEKYGDAQVGGLTIDHAKKKSLIPSLEENH